MTPSRQVDVARCDGCRNDYGQSFTVRGADGGQYILDSLACAAHQMAPTCASCGCHVLGHGVQAASTVYCCAPCVYEAGVEAVKDRV